jgi:electron transfer flavoprotein beta subunit
MSFHIIVCIKSVITEVPKGKIVRSADNQALNPFDRPALEAALALKQKLGGKVTALSMGPATAGTALLEAMAMGVDHGVLACDAALAGSDTIATSTVLAAAINKLAPFDLILFGTRTADSDTGQVGPQTAVMLDLPMVTGVYQWETGAQELEVARKADGFVERFRLRFPAALTIDATAVKPREIPLGGIETAFERQAIQFFNLAALGLREEQVGEAGSPTRVISMSRVKRDRTCDFIDGEPREQAEGLIQRLVGGGLIA